MLLLRKGHIWLRLLSPELLRCWNLSQQPSGRPKTKLCLNENGSDNVP